MPAPYKTSRRVEFQDTDAAGMMHFAAFFRFMEVAEHEYLRHLGLSVLLHDDEGPISWPRVSAHCDYRGALRFEDIVEIEVQVVRRGEKSITYGFTFTHQGRPIAEGQMTSVCCRLSSTAPPRSIAIPEWIAARFREDA